MYKYFASNANLLDFAFIVQRQNRHDMCRWFVPYFRILGTLTCQPKPINFGNNVLFFIQVYHNIILCMKPCMVLLLLHIASSVLRVLKHSYADFCFTKHCFYNYFINPMVKFFTVHMEQLITSLFLKGQFVYKINSLLTN